MKGFLDLQAYLGRQFIHPGGRDLTEVLLARFPLVLGWVLDLGCGTGATSALIASQSEARVVGLDRSPAMLAQARARRRREGLASCLDLVQADGNRRLPFGDEVFDVVYAEPVVALLDVQAVIRECARVLNPGGTLAMVERIWAPGVTQALADEVNAVSRREFGIAAATRKPLDREDWLAMLDQSGLAAGQALAVDDLLPVSRTREPWLARLCRLYRYLLRPIMIWRAWRFGRAIRRHATLFAHLESYLFLAQKPA